MNEHTPETRQAWLEERVEWLRGRVATLEIRANQQITHRAPDDPNAALRRLEYAAPDLLETLERCRAVLISQAFKLHRHKESITSGEGAIEAASAAIARATGDDTP